MPIYEFVDENGVTWEHFMSSDEAPRLGDSVVIDGKTLVRTICAPRPTVKRDLHFKAWSQPHLDRYGNLPEDAIRAPHYDKDGVAVFTSQKEKDEYVAKSEGRVIYGE